MSFPFDARRYDFATQFWCRLKNRADIYEGGLLFRGGPDDGIVVASLLVVDLGLVELFRLVGAMRTRSISQVAVLTVAYAALVPLCLAQGLSSDTAQYAAKVLTSSGRVSVLRESTPWALSPGDQVQCQQIIVTGMDGHATFQVSDGSTFEVFPNSRVAFRKNVPNWRDLIDVFLGQVRVHIQKLGNIPNPNRVITPTAVISVRGTTFDITVEDEGESTLVQVEEGLVEVQHALLPRGEGKLLTDGEELRVFKEQPLVARGMDKGAVIERVLRAVVDAVNTVVLQGRGVGKIPGSTGGGGIGGGLGDKGAPPPPPPH
jgi:FecR protein